MVLTFRLGKRPGSVMVSICSEGYKIIKQLNDRMLAINPNLIVLSGKANRKFYEENCYGMVKQALKRPFSGKRKVNNTWKTK